MANNLYADDYMDVVVNHVSKNNKTHKKKKGVKVNSNKKKKTKKEIDRQKRDELIRLKRRMPPTDNNTENYQMDVVEYYSPPKKVGKKRKFSVIEKDDRIDMIKKMSKSLSREDELILSIINSPQPVAKTNIITLFVVAHGSDSDVPLQNIDNTLILSFPGLSGVCGLYYSNSSPVFESLPEIMKTIQSNIDRYAIMTDFLNDFQVYYKSKYLGLLDYLNLNPSICNVLGANICKNILFSNSHKIGIDFIIPFFDHNYYIKNIVVDGTEIASINIIDHTVHTTYTNGNIHIEKNKGHFKFEDVYQQFLNKTGNKVVPNIKIDPITNRISEITLSSLHHIFNTIFDNLQLNVIDISCREKSKKEIDSTDLFTFIHENEKAKELMKQRKKMNIG
jgi:hypothetical protein